MDKAPLYPMADDVRALYDAGWTGENVAATKPRYGSGAQDWLDEVVFTFRMAQAASRDLVAHDGSDWPNHPVYAASGGYGGAHADAWKKHEAKIREFLGAKRPDFYLAFKKDDPNKVDDPALRVNATSIVDKLEQADKAVWKDIKGIRMTERPWGAYVTTITDVRPHGDNLSIVTTEDGHEVVANRREDGSFRWAKGEVCVYVPEGAIVPEDVLQERGYWDADKGKGLLEGKKGNRVKMRRMAGFESRGLLFKVGHPGEDWTDDAPKGSVGWVLREGLQPETDTRYVFLDDDVSDFFGITEHVAG